MLTGLWVCLAALGAAQDITTAAPTDDPSDNTTNVTGTTAAPAEPTAEPTPDTTTLALEISEEALAVLLADLDAAKTALGAGIADALNISAERVVVTNVAAAERRLAGGRRLATKTLNVDFYVKDATADELATVADLGDNAEALKTSINAKLTAQFGDTVVITGVTVVVPATPAPTPTSITPAPTPDPDRDNSALGGVIVGCVAVALILGGGGYLATRHPAQLPWPEQEEAKSPGMTRSGSSHKFADQI